MTESDAALRPQDTARTPWWFWTLATLGALFLALNAAGLVSTYVFRAAYLESMTEAQRAYLASMPLWDTAIWTAAHLLAALSGLLLVLRRRLALPGLVTATLLFAISTVYTLAFTALVETFGEGAPVYHAISLIVLALLIALSAWGARAGVLR